MARAIRRSTRSDQRARAAEASRAWASLIALFTGAEHQERFASTARDLGLTPASMKALMHIEPGAGVPMRDIAGVLHCDASNVTQLVDALEQPEFVERVPSSADRRVKLVRLTEAGAEARTQILDSLHTPPAALREALSAEELAALASLLQKVVDHEQPDTTAADTTSPPADAAAEPALAG